MANIKQLTESGLCLNCCICCLTGVPITSRWTLFCQRWLGSSALSWASDSVSSPCVSLLKGQPVAVLCLEHEIPLPGAEEDTKCYFSLLSETLQRCACVYRVHKSHFHSIFSPRSAVSTRLLLFPLLSSVTDLSVFHFLSRVPWDLGVLSTGAQNRFSRCLWHSVWCLTHRLCL